MASISQARSHRLHIGYTTFISVVTLIGFIGLLYIPMKFTSGFLMVFNAYEETYLESVLAPVTFVDLPWYLVLLQAVLTGAFGYAYMRARLYAITFFHRMFVHLCVDEIRSSKVHIFVKYGFNAAFQGLRKLWGGWHVQHHAETDTPDDLHSPIVYGGPHSQWWVVKSEFIKPAKSQYLRSFERSRFARAAGQERHYLKLAAFFAFMVPTVVCTLWLDPIGGFLFAACTGQAVLWELTWTINSVMHIFGDHRENGGSATNSRSKLYAREVVGEPSHANHHGWEQSYRMGEFDPGADRIEEMARRGWIYGLKLAPIFEPPSDLKDQITILPWPNSRPQPA